MKLETLWIARHRQELEDIMNTSSADILDNFDLDDPNLPREVEDAALSSGDYPYDRRMKRSHYEETLEALQTELVKLQAHIERTDGRLVLVFEGRDAAGKGGTISRFRQYLNPRSAPIVALPKPTEREQGEWYFQRYVKKLPSSGEITLFDRSWYNRGVVEPVMGFCTADQTRAFLSEAPAFESMLARDGVRIFKFWLNIGREMQLMRFHERRHNPLKAWKISPVDLKAIARWDDYTTARDKMIAATHTPDAPWTIIKGNDKRRSRINAIRHVLLAMDYEGKDNSVLGERDPKIIAEGLEFLHGAGSA